MPKFSQASFSKLSTCHIDLQTLFYEVIRTYDCTVLAGFRNEQEQHQAFLTKASKVDWPNGKHNQNPSIAVDVLPYPLNYSEGVKNIARHYAFAGFVLGVASRLKEEGKMSRSVRWGGDWDGDRDFEDQTFNDLGHFELI